MLSDQEVQSRHDVRNDVTTLCRPITTEEIVAEYLGEGSHLGYRVYRYRSIQPDRSVPLAQKETWYAPDLGCYPDHDGLEGKDQNGIVIKLFEREVSKITLGEPSAELFDDPSDYRHVVPSEQMTAVYTLQKKSPTEADRNFWAGIDEVHKRALQNKR